MNRTTFWFNKSKKLFKKKNLFSYDCSTTVLVISIMSYMLSHDFTANLHGSKIVLPIHAQFDRFVHLLINLDCY